MCVLKRASGIKGIEIDARMRKRCGEANAAMVKIASEYCLDQKRSNRCVHQSMPRKSNRVDEILLARVSANERIGVGGGSIETAGCCYQAARVREERRELLDLFKNSVSVIVDAIIVTEWRIDAILVGVIE